MFLYVSYVWVDLRILMVLIKFKNLSIAIKNVLLKFLLCQVKKKVFYVLLKTMNMQLQIKCKIFFPKYKNSKNLKKIILFAVKKDYCSLKIKKNKIHIFLGLIIIWLLIFHLMRKRGSENTDWKWEKQLLRYFKFKVFCCFFKSS